MVLHREIRLGAAFVLLFDVMLFFGQPLVLNVIFSFNDMQEFKNIGTYFTKKIQMWVTIKGGLLQFI